MVMTCSVCRSTQREQTDKLLIDNAPLRDIARQFDLSKDAVRRHKESHLPKALMQSKEVQAIVHGDNLVNQLADITARTIRILETAERKKDPRTALAAIREIRGNLDLQGKLLGEFNKNRPISALSKHLHLHGASIDDLRALAEAEEQGMPTVLNPVGKVKDSLLSSTPCRHTDHT